MSIRRSDMQARERYAERIAEAVQRVERADADLDAVIEAARSEGVPWYEIGMALGLTPQGAQQRYERRLEGRIRRGRLPARAQWS